jgi:hypothetical protein
VRAAIAFVVSDARSRGDAATCIGSFGCALSAAPKLAEQPQGATQVHAQLAVFALPESLLDPELARGGFLWLCFSQLAHFWKHQTHRTSRGAHASAERVRPMIFTHNA